MSAPTRPCLACEGRGWLACRRDEPGWRLVKDCPVCLGSGRVEAKPSVRDALADAETLRANNYLDGVSSDCLRTPMSALWSYIDARGSARAAFRAVPGLRGE